MNEVAHFEPDEIAIEPLTPEDAEALFAGIIALAEEEYVLIGTPFDRGLISTTADDFRRWLEQPEEEGPFMARKAVVDGKMVGFAIYGDRGFGSWSGTYDMDTNDSGETRSVYLDDLRVEPEYRGNGIGTLLIKEAARLAIREALPLTLTVNSKNEGALRLYRRLGGEVTGEASTRRPGDLKMRFEKSVLKKLIES